MSTTTTRIRPHVPASWAVLLAGPVVGMVYFTSVYFLAEVTCSEDLDLVSSTVLRIVCLAAAAASVVVLTLFVWRARRLHAAARPVTVPPGAPGSEATEPSERDAAEARRENQRFMATTGLMLLGLFLLFVLFLTAPVVSSSLC